jgi:hypothetical protein
LTVSARNINQVSGEASGVAAGSKVGIGIALVINVVTDKTLATTRTQYQMLMAAVELQSRRSQRLQYHCQSRDQRRRTGGRRK